MNGLCIILISFLCQEKVYQATWSAALPPPWQTYRKTQTRIAWNWQPWIGYYLHHGKEQSISIISQIHSIIGVSLVPFTVVELPPSSQRLIYFLPLYILCERILPFKCLQISSSEILLGQRVRDRGRKREKGPEKGNISFNTVETCLQLFSWCRAGRIYQYSPLPGLLHFFLVPAIFSSHSSSEHLFTHCSLSRQE